MMTILAIVLNTIILGIMFIFYIEYGQHKVAYTIILIICAISLYVMYHMIFAVALAQPYGIAEAVCATSASIIILDLLYSDLADILNE